MVKKHGDTKPAPGQDIPTDDKGKAAPSANPLEDLTPEMVISEDIPEDLQERLDAQEEAKFREAGIEPPPKDAEAPETDVPPTADAPQGPQGDTPLEGKQDAGEGKDGDPPPAKEPKVSIEHPVYDQEKGVWTVKVHGREVEMDTDRLIARAQMGEADYDRHGVYRRMDKVFQRYPELAKEFDALVKGYVLNDGKPDPAPAAREEGDESKDLTEYQRELLDELKTLGIVPPAKGQPPAEAGDNRVLEARKREAREFLDSRREAEVRRSGSPEQFDLVHDTMAELRRTNPVDPGTGQPMFTERQLAGLNDPHYEEFDPIVGYSRPLYDILADRVRTAFEMQANAGAGGAPPPGDPAGNAGGGAPPAKPATPPPPGTETYLLDAGESDPAGGKAAPVDWSNDEAYQKKLDEVLQQEG